MLVAEYRIRIQSDALGKALKSEDEDALQAAVDEAEDVLNAALPEGFKAKIEDA
jgi:hypothetical protein